MAARGGIKSFRFMGSYLVILYSCFVTQEKNCDGDLWTAYESV